MGLIAVALVSSPAHLLCRGAFGMAFCAKWGRCSEKTIPPTLCRAKWHQNKGFAHVAVIGTLHVPFGAGDFPKFCDISRNVPSHYRYGHYLMPVLVMYRASIGIGQRCKYANTGTGTI
jgi:hypothetical protein